MRVARTIGLLFCLGTVTASLTAQSGSAPPASQAAKELLDLIQPLRQAADSAFDRQAASIAARDVFEECVALSEADRAAGGWEVFAAVGAVAGRALDFELALESWRHALRLASATHDLGHERLRTSRKNVAAMLGRLGRYDEAEQLQRAHLEVVLAGHAEDRELLDQARMDLFLTLYGIGRFEDAEPVAETIVRGRLERHGAAHEATWAAQRNLGAVKHALGDTLGAAQVFEDVLRARGDLPADPILTMNLAVVSEELGDLPRAHALYERVLDLYASQPEEPLEACWTRVNLALVEKAMGEYEAAYAAETLALETALRHLPADHFRVQWIRGHIATSLLCLGKVEAAERQYRETLSALQAAEGTDKLSLLAPMEGLARALYRKGEHAEAETLLRRILTESEGVLRRDHPRLLHTRAALARALYDRGEIEQARELSRHVVEARRLIYPDSHPKLSIARADSITYCAAAGDRARCLELAQELVAGLRAGLANWALSPAERSGLANEYREVVSQLVSLALGVGDVEPMVELQAEALLLVETLRGIVTRTARRTRDARARDPARFAEIDAELRSATRALAVLSRTEADADDSHTQRLLEAARRRDIAARSLVELVPSVGMDSDPAAAIVARLAKRLPEDGVAVALVALDRPRAGSADTDRVLTAFVLARDASVSAHDLGLLAPIESAIAQLRNRGAAVRGVPPRAPSGRDDASPVLVELRERVLEPLLGRLADARTIIVSDEAALQLLPFDALPLADGRAAGDRFSIRHVVSLLDLLDSSPRTAPATPSLLLVGDLDYGDRGAGRWPPLPGTAREIDALASVFAGRFAEAPVSILRGSNAGRAAIEAAVAGTTFVHLATHGYFAGSVTSTREPDAGGLVASVSPMVLTGLALSGANALPDASGAHAGLVTAQELLAFDLSRCILVTLSACDTSAGVRRAGEGYASLRAAALGAGARYALTSLWAVPDAATAELMQRFYRQVWVEKRDPYQALWNAKKALRAGGGAFHDWAGWQLTGL